VKRLAKGQTNAPFYVLSLSMTRRVKQFYNIDYRKKELLVKKEVFQFMRDVEDENIWIEEKMNVVTSEDYGNTLQVSVL